MTTEIPLLPLPEWMSHYTIPADGFEGVKVVMLADRMHDYARANVEHHTEALRAEADALREALECMIIGACAVAVPHNGERAVLQDAVNIARAAIAAYRKGGKK